MENKNETPQEHYDQDKVWNEIVDMIQNEAKLLHALVFQQYALSFMILKQQIANTYDIPNTSSQQNKASLQSRYALIVEKKSALQNQFIEDLGTLKTLREENQENPRSLLILDVAEKNVKELRSYATHHQPNVQTLEKDLNAIRTVIPEVEVAPTVGQTNVGG